MHMRIVLLAAAIAALTFGSASATMRITDDMGGLMTEYASRFAEVRNVKPKASRPDSSEVYLVATGFKGR